MSTVQTSQATAIAFTIGIDTSGMHILSVDGDVVVITPSFFDADHTSMQLFRDNPGSVILWQKDEPLLGRLIECRKLEPGNDGLDSDGYPLDQPREWSEDEIAELRRRQYINDDYGRDI